MYITTAIANNMEGGRMTPKKNRSTRRMRVPVPFCQPQTSSAVVQPCLSSVLHAWRPSLFKSTSFKQWKTAAEPNHVDSSCVASKSSSENKTHHRYWCSLSAEREEGRSDRTLKQSVQWELSYFVRYFSYVLEELQRTSSYVQPVVTSDAFCASSLSKPWKPSSCWTRSSSYVAIEPMTCSTEHK